MINDFKVKKELKIRKERKKERSVVMGQEFLQVFQIEYLIYGKIRKQVGCNSLHYGVATGHMMLIKTFRFPLFNDFKNQSGKKKIVCCYYNIDNLRMIFYFRLIDQ